MKRFVSLVALTFAMIGLTAFLAAPAHADTAHATSKSCDSGQVMTGATFTLTDVESDQRITVNTLPGLLHPSPNYTPATRTATYSVSLNAPLESPPAVATVPTGWSGAFSLTNMQCVAAKPPGIAAEVTACGIAPVTLTVRITNNNPVWTVYKLTLSGRGTQNSTLSPGEREEITFPSLTRGDNYTLLVRGNGREDSSAIKVDSCSGGTTPVVPAKKKTASPNSVPSPTDEPTIDPLPSESPVPSKSPVLSAPENIGMEDSAKTTDSSGFMDLWGFKAGCPLVIVGLLVCLFIWRKVRHRSTTP